MPVGARRSLSVVVVSLCAVIAALALGSAAALAAAPETPELKVEAVTAKTATFNGVLSPKSPGELGSTYQFLYRISKTECKGESKAPEPPGMSLGGEAEPVSEPVSGLTPNTAYTVCLHVENAAKTEEAVSLPAHFITALEAPETLAAEPVGLTTATLKGVLSPNATVAGEPAGYEFLYRQSATECQGGEVGRLDGEPKEQKATSAAPASGSKQEVTAPVTGLQPGTQYTFCLLERNVGNETAVGPAVTFTTHGVGISEEQATSVEATAATLQAEIDPNESSTSYHFEYDTSPYTSSASHGTSLPMPSEAIGSGTSRVPVSVRLTGLQPGATYYYRVVAVDEIETFDGLGKALTTPATPGLGSSGTCPNEQLRAEQPYGLGLPDCRAYEVVSPLESNGQDATDPINVLGSRASVSGEAVTYMSNAAFAEPAGSLIRDQLLSRRGPGGWSTQSITLPDQAYHANQFNDYELGMAFTPELTEGVARTIGSMPGTGAPPGYWELYLAEFANDSTQWLSNVPEAEEQYDPGEGEPGAFVMGASSDLSHVVFTTQSNSDLLPEWVSGKVTPAVNVNNGGEVIPAGAGTDHATNFGPNLEGDVWHAVSSDGSRVFFTSYADGQVYVRENAEQEQSPLGPAGDCVEAAMACTVEVSGSQRVPVDPNGEYINASGEKLPRPARYWGAGADGSKVFFTSKAELTDDAYTGPDDNAANLYECQLVAVEEVGHPIPRCDLKDLTGEATDATGDGASVLGVVQISEEGSYVYFVAEGALTSEENARGARAEAGRWNLYVSHEGGKPRFIATLYRGDEANWLQRSSEAGESYGPATNNATVTPDGTRLAFTSEAELTGYDNEQAEPGECEINHHNTEPETGRCREIYLYDAVTGRLVCASCNPSGARPVGPANLRVPPYAVTITEYRPRDLIADGTLFFDSSDALVPHASDGRRNVYEYENGHVYAISDVAGGYESFFLDASANGENVFFATADQLLRQDVSNNIVVYDARVGGGFPVTLSSPTCSNADSCKPPVSLQPSVFGAPASATFAGVGNATMVAAPSASKQTAKKAAKCTRAGGRRQAGTDRCGKKKRRKKTVKARRSSDGRRASR